METLSESFAEPPSSEEPPSCKIFNCTEEEFNDWKWQIKNSITTKDELEKYITLIEDEKKYFELADETNLKFRITPYFLNLIIGKPDNYPLRKIVIPRQQEFVKSEGESIDPLCEDETNPVKVIIHRYKNKVLFLSTDFCSCNCRFCTRSRKINHEHITIEDLKEGILYIKNHPEVADVVVSGGDPILLCPEILDFILGELYKIPHVQIIRIGTRAPVVIPQIIFNNPDLISVLKKYWQKLWINIHFENETEITEEVKKACLLLASLGIPLNSQTVLLQDINSETETMKNLMQKLLTIKVRPVYLYSMDRIIGSSHFKVSIEKGIEIMRGLQGHISGMAIPRFVCDSKFGKIPIDLGYIIENKKNYYKFKSYEEKEFEYYE